MVSRISHAGIAQVRVIHATDDARAVMGYEVSLKPMSGSRTLYINRAPVLTLWAALVAERLGFRRDEALTLGRAVAGLAARIRKPR
jgi:hypothetical protein